MNFNEHVNTVGLIHVDYVPKDWYAFTVIHAPVTATEIILYLNEWGIDVLFTGVGREKYLLWIKKEQLPEVLQHTEKFDEWRDVCLRYMYNLAKIQLENR